MPDDDAELVKAGVQGVVEGTLAPFAGLIQSLFGPAASEAGLMLEDQVHQFRLRRQIRLFQVTAGRLKEAGITPNRVPFKLLEDIIGNASREEDDNLQDLWANMLASAADGRNPALVVPSFPAILKELSVKEVKFLDLLYVKAKDRVINRPARQKPIRSIDAVTFEIVAMQHLYATDVLNMKLEPGRALQIDPEILQERAQEQVFFARTFAFSLGLLKRHELLNEVIELRPTRMTKDPPDFMTKYRLSFFGTRFVEACRAPKAT